MNKFDYVKMQKDYYEKEASQWSPSDRDKVVGSFDEHNAWDDYEYLFKDVTDTQGKICLDFGCGPGRNIVRFWNRFKRIDGVDIAKNNLEKAKIWLKHNNINPEESNLFECNGYDLSNITDSQYDLIISTICMQHICVHEIRLGYFREFYRVLKPQGQISIQMGFGENNKASDLSNYYDNSYDAKYTNGGHDTLVHDITNLKNDLTSIGYTDFNAHIRPTGPGDRHSNWLFFNARKP